MWTNTEKAHLREIRWRHAMLAIDVCGLGTIAINTDICDLIANISHTHKDRDRDREREEREKMAYIFKRCDIVGFWCWIFIYGT